MQKTNDNIIIWEKWKDPFGMDDNISSLIEDNFEFLDSDEYNNEIQEEDEIYDTDEEIKKVKIPMIITPFGLIPYTENTASGKIFNFWIGHTNFNVSPPVATIIEEADGVESLDVFTRYRFRISIGKAFKASQIMHNINTKIYKYLESLENDKKSK